jgi:hypothetical protein
MRTQPGGRKTGLTNKTGPMIWERIGKIYYAKIVSLEGAIHLHLIAEPTGNRWRRFVTGKRWRWFVWKPGETVHEARKGFCGTAQEAMHNAGRAATGRTASSRFEKGFSSTFRLCR